MTIALVSAGAITNGAVAFGQATTAGNFLVCMVAASSGAGVSGTGWVTDVTDSTSGFGGVVIAHKANCGAGETAPTATGGANVIAQVAEFSGVATSLPTDRTLAGGNGSAQVSTLTATAGGTDSAAGELVIAADWCVNGGATAFTVADVFNNGTVHQLGWDTGSTSGYNAFAQFSYSVTTSNSSADSWQATTSSPVVWFDIALASFKAAAAAPAYAPPAFRGSFVPQIRASFH